MKHIMNSCMALISIVCFVMATWLAVSDKLPEATYLLVLSVATRQAIAP